MRIAAIGTGNNGGTLGRAFARAGHQVTFGSRHPGDDQAAGDTSAVVAELADALDNAQVVPLWFSLVQARGGNRNLAFRILEK